MRYVSDNKSTARMKRLYMLKLILNEKTYDVMVGFYDAI